MKSVKDIKELINSFPDYLVIDIHNILDAFQKNNKEEVERLVSEVYRTDYGKVILTTSEFIKSNSLEEHNKTKRNELREQGYSEGAIEFLAGLLASDIDKELNWDALEFFSKKLYAMSDEEKSRRKLEQKGVQKKYAVKSLLNVLKLVIILSSYLPICILILWVPDHYKLNGFIYLLLFVGLFPIPFLVHKALYSDKKEAL